MTAWVAMPPLVGAAAKLRNAPLRPNFHIAAHVGRFQDLELPTWIVCPPNRKQCATSARMVSKASFTASPRPSGTQWPTPS